MDFQIQMLVRPGTGAQIFLIPLQSWKSFSALCFSQSSQTASSVPMASSVTYSVVDDKDLDDVALWAVIDSAAASASVSSSKSHKTLAISHPNFQSPTSGHSSQPKFPKYPVTPQSAKTGVRSPAGGEVVHEPWVFQPPRKIARTCPSEMSENSPLALVKSSPRMPVAPIYSSPEAYMSPQIMAGSECYSGGYPRHDDGENMKHSLTGRFPSVSLFKDYQNAAMEILEKSDYTVISGNLFIKKTGWRKISFYFNLSFEIKDKTIEFDENRNVVRAEFIVRAHMQGGRFSDGWGSCERREKRFTRPNHDIPSTAETRAKNRASQDLLGIGEYRRDACQAQR